MKKTLIVSILLLVLALPASAQENIVSIGDYTVNNTGETIRVPVNLTNASNVGGVAYILKYNTSVVNITSSYPADNGDFIGFALTYNITQESIVVGAVGTGINGNRIINYLHLKAVGNPGDKSPLDFTAVAVTNPAGQPLPNSSINGSFTINVITDTTPPSSITNLTNITSAQTYINWTWTDPSDPDFSNVTIYLNGIFQQNVSKGIQYYNATNLTPGTHTIATRTADTSGNINQTWINHTATTLSSGEIRGDVNRNGKRDTGDATLILRSIVGLPIPSQYMPILSAGDMNCNGKLDTGDATLILRDIVNLSIPRCWE